MKSRSQFGAWFAAAALLCGLVFAAEAAQAQARRKQQPPARGQQGQAKSPKAQRGQNQQGFRPGQGEPPFMERLRQLPPRQQERVLRNHPAFQNMAPEEQARIRENLRRWNNMNPQQRQAFLDRQEKWRQMTPEQRRHVREVLMPRWQQLEPQRRQAIMRRMGALRDLNDEQRAAKLNDEAFLSGLNNDDRELLRELSKLRLPPPEPHEPPQEPLLF